MVLNNTSWTFLSDTCPVSSLAPLRPLSPASSASPAG